MLDDETRQLKAHVQQVMATSNGRAMFDLLKRRHVEVQIYRADPRAQDAAIGKHDLVQELIQLGEDDDVS